MNSDLLRNHGITAEQYQALFDAQAGVCAICGQPEKVKHWSGTLQRLAVDHDHRDGRVRGLLCNACNLIVGHLEWLDRTLIPSFLAYLDRDVSANPVDSNKVIGRQVSIRIVKARRTPVETETEPLMDHLC